MADSDTRSPYDDEVVDPYAADDTKNPHEGSEGGDEEATGGEASEEKTPRRASRTSKTAKKT